MCVKAEYFMKYNAQAVCSNMKTQPRSEKNRHYYYTAQCFNVIRHKDALLRKRRLKERIPITLYMKNLYSKKNAQRNSQFANTDHLLGMSADEDVTVVSVKKNQR